MRKALVTGGAGFIGSNLAIELQSAGWDVRVLDDFSCGTLDNLRRFEGQIYNEDICRIDTLADPWFPDTVFHMAAVTDTTIDNYSRMKRVNVDGFVAVLRYADRKGTKVVYASSAAVYGNGRTPMLESQELFPLNAYAKSKLEMENIGRDYAARNRTVLIGLRYFNVYGPGEKHKKHAASMVHQLALQIALGNRPQLFQWGEQARDQVYVKDAVRAALLAAQSGQSGLYNVGTGNAVSFVELVNSLTSLLGRSAEPEFINNPYEAIYQNKTEADTHHAKLGLGFNALYDFRRGIQEYFRTEDFLNK